MKRQLISALILTGVLSAARILPGEEAGTAPGPVMGVTADSAVFENEDFLSPVFLIDGTDRPWCGQKGRQAFTLEFDDPGEVSAVYAVNGHGAPALRQAYGRVRELAVATWSDEKNAYLTRATLELKDTDQPQKLVFSRPVKSRDLYFIVKSVYQGAKHDGACLAELSYRPVTIVPHRAVRRTPPARKTVKVSWANFTLLDDGRIVPDKPDGLCDCACPFVGGTWGTTTDGETYVHVVRKINANCGSKTAKVKGPWRYFEENYILRKE